MSSSTKGQKISVKVHVTVAIAVIGNKVDLADKEEVTYT